MTREEVEKLAIKFMDAQAKLHSGKSRTELVIDKKKTKEYELLWVCHFTPQKYLDDPTLYESDPLVGGGPIMISKINGVIYSCGSADSTSGYVKKVEDDIRATIFNQSERPFSEEYDFPVKYIVW